MLAQLVWNKIDAFCEENSLSKDFVRITNVCSKIILSNKKMRITFHLEEMECYLLADIEFFDAKGKTIQTERISASTSKKIDILRNKGLHSWRKVIQKRFFSNMVDEYIYVLQTSTRKQLLISEDSFEA